MVKYSGSLTTDSADEYRIENPEPFLPLPYIRFVSVSSVVKSYGRLQQRSAVGGRTAVVSHAVAKDPEIASEGIANSSLSSMRDQYCQPRFIPRIVLVRLNSVILERFRPRLQFTPAEIRSNNLVESEAEID